MASTEQQLQVWTASVDVFPPASAVGGDAVVATWLPAEVSAGGRSVTRSDARPRAAYLVSRFAKRLLDVVLASVAVVLAAPLVLVLALLVKFTSPGPAFFRQVRVGRSGRTFRILKLRTMHSDAEAQLLSEPALRATYLENGFKVPPELDSRLTTLGRFMRRASLDELPQLVNVMRGHMSLVGPRPVVPLELGLLGDVRGLYEEVRPGITGYWQVNGRSDVATCDRIELDRHYLVHWSLWLDLKILVRTLPAVFTCRGAH